MCTVVSLYAAVDPRRWRQEFLQHSSNYGEADVILIQVMCTKTEKVFLELFNGCVDGRERQMKTKCWRGGDRAIKKKKPRTASSP